MASKRTSRQQSQGLTRGRSPREGGDDGHHTCQYRDQLDDATKRIADLEARLKQQKVADRLSISQVSEQVNTLNKVIVDTTSIVYKAMIPGQYPEEQVAAALPVAVEFLGPNVPSMLIAESRTGSSSVRSDLCQTIVRICIIHSCTRLIQEWCPGDEEKSRMCDTMYTHIRGTEDQLVAGRWRAMTRSRLIVNLDTWNEGFLADFRKLLTVAGWKIASRERSLQFVRDLTVVFEVAQKTRRSVGEMVVSTDLGILSPAGGTSTESNTSRDQHTPPEELIVGTISLGLEEIRVEGIISISPCHVIAESAVRMALSEKWSQGSRGSVSSNSPDRGDSHTAIVATSVYESAEQRAIRKPFRR